MEEQYRAYLAVLDGLSNDLEKLAELTREQTAVVLRDDLMALNDVMKREQVIGLSLRGREQKRQKLAVQLGLDGTRLAALAQLFPKQLYHQARETAERLQTSYRIYSEAAQVARSTLEINLHEIEKIVSSLGVSPAQKVSFRESSPIEPPKNMKTDFRA